jgi:hypothetical protein
LSTTNRVIEQVHCLSAAALDLKQTMRIFYHPLILSLLFQNHEPKRLSNYHQDRINNFCLPGLAGRTGQ